MNNLDQQFQNFSALIDKCQKTERQNEELSKLVEFQKKGLEFYQNTTRNLRRQSLNTVRTESLTVLCNKLQAKNQELNQEIAKLKQDLTDSESNFSRDKENSINEYAEKIREYEAQILQKTEDLEKKENDMYVQIQAYQASTDLLADEQQSKWQKLLNDTNRKLKDSNNTCNVLRSQLVVVNNRVDDAEKHIQELQDKLIFTENQLHLAQEKLLQSRHSAVPKFSASRQRCHNITKPATSNIPLSDTESNSGSVGRDTYGRQNNYNKLNVSSHGANTSIRENITTPASSFHLSNADSNPGSCGTYSSQNNYNSLNVSSHSSNTSVRETITKPVTNTRSSGTYSCQNNYNPLNVSAHTSVGGNLEDFQNRSVEARSRPILLPKKSNVRNLPPLKQITQAQSNVQGSFNKKRKLYNPNDLQHLNQEDDD